MLKCCDEHCGNESGNTCKNEGGCTSALLLDDAKRACDNLVVGKHERWTGACNICQTVHGTCPVVDVAVVFDDADEDTAKISREHLGIRFGVFSHHETRNRTNGFVAAKERGHNQNENKLIGRDVCSYRQAETGCSRAIMLRRIGRKKGDACIMGDDGSLQSS